MDFATLAVGFWLEPIICQDRLGTSIRRSFYTRVFLSQAAPPCVLDYTPLLRAQLLNLVSWVEDGRQPPLSVHPRLSDGTAADRLEVLRAFPAPGFRTPAPERLWVTKKIDLGPLAAEGIGRYPPAER
jgi:hypothetical protein